MRDDERLFVGDAGMIVAAGATQKLVESFAAGDSILSPVTASDLDALPALFFSSGVWLLCWLVPATYRGVYDDAVCLRRPSSAFNRGPRSPPDPAQVSEDAPARALDAAVNAAQLRVLYELGRVYLLQTPTDVVDVSIGIVNVVLYLAAWRALYAYRFKGYK